MENSEVNGSQPQLQSPEQSHVRKYPITKDFRECPVCGGKHRIAEDELNHLKGIGSAGKNLQAFLFTHTGMIMDQTKFVLTAPLISTFYDVCSDCGTAYCVHVDVVQAVPQLKSR